MYSVWRGHHGGRGTADGTRTAHQLESHPIASQFSIEFDPAWLFPWISMNKIFVFLGKRLQLSHGFWLLYGFHRAIWSTYNLYYDVRAWSIDDSANSFNARNPVKSTRALGPSRWRKTRGSLKRQRRKKFKCNLIKMTRRPNHFDGASPKRIFLSQGRYICTAIKHRVLRYGSCWTSLFARSVHLGSAHSIRKIQRARGRLQSLTRSFAPSRFFIARQ